MAAVQRVYQNGFRPDDDGAEWDDPIQGKAVSCNLIASLSSCGWVCKSRVRQVKLENDTFTIVNHDGSRGGIYHLDGDVVQETTDVAVDNQLFMENGCPIHGHVDNDLGIFPALYEKLWLKWRTAVDYPDVAQAPTNRWSANRRGLLAISGWWNGGAVPYEDNWIPWNTITKVCEYYDNNGVVTGGGKTKVPMVAWTKDVLPRADGFNQMMKSHCYSVLGVLNPNDCGGRRYIVLRNPHATAELYNGVYDPDCNPAILWEGRRLPWSDQYPNCEYTETGRQDLTRDVGHAVLNVWEGVFAITNNQFASNFQGFGWVGMPLPVP